MLPCIACKKHATTIDDEDDEDDHHNSTSVSAKEVKSLSSQLKDVVLKVSAAYRQCRPCSSLRGDGGNLVSLDHEFTTTSDASSSDGWINNNHTKSVGSKLNSDASSVSEGNAFTSKVDQEISKVSPSSQLSSSSNGTSKTDASNSDTQEDHGAVTAAQEWVAQVEPGVLITFIAMANGENELKRIRFSRELFNKWQAEAWWGENCERVHELYNVSGSDRSFPNSRKESEQQQQHQKQDSTGTDHEKMKAITADEMAEWVEEDEPGVYITVKLGPSGNRELKRVRFSREKFTEKQAKLWWEKNRFRIHDNYL